MTVEIDNRIGGVLNRLAGAAVVVVLVATSTALAQSRASAVELVRDSQRYEVHYTASFSEESLTFAESMGHDVVRLDGTDRMEEFGRPALPVQTIRIALPPGMLVTGVLVTDTEAIEIPGEYAIYPAQAPKRTSERHADADFAAGDPAAYASEAAYPGKLVEFEDQTDLAGQAMGVIRLYPLQYVAAEKKLTLHTSVSIVLEGVDGYVCGDYLPARLSERSRVTYAEMLAEMVVNPADVELRVAEQPPLRTRGVPPGDYDYVIILREDWTDEFQSLADWRTKCGTPANMVTLTWITGEYSGADDKEKIRNFIIDAHTNWGTTYFLLAGEHETLPFEYRVYYDGSSTPSDQYYSDYDDDWTNEVFVGRLSVSGPIQIGLAVGKILTYETNPPMSNYARRALLLGMDLNATTHGEALKEMIAAYIDPGWTVTKVYDSDATNHKTATINALNAGQNLFNHDDHCNWNTMGTGVENHGWSIGLWDVDDLTNDGALTVVVSTGCRPNQMDYGSSDCIAEYFLLRNDNQAGVAFTGNTRDGWFLSGDPDALTSELDKKWWYGLFTQNKYILGETIVYAKHNFAQGTDIRKHCEWTFNLLGDPLLHIWKDDPETFIVTHNPTLPIGSSSFDVHVADGAGNVSGATVCLWKGTEVYLIGSTNTSGYAYFTPSPTSSGTMYVTVTKQDYQPYQGTATVEGDEGCPQPGASGNYCTGDVYPNNGDGVWNYVDDGDCTIGISDLGELLPNYGTTSGATREDGDVYPVGAPDGAVGISDLGELLAQYGDDCN